MNGSIAVGNLCDKLYISVNGINVVYKLLVVFCLLDDTGVINISNPNLEGLGAVLMALDSNSCMNRLAIMRLMGNPWLHHGPLHNTFLRRANRYFQAEFHQCSDVLYGH